MTNALAATKTPKLDRENERLSPIVPPTSQRASSVWDALPSAHQPIQLINPGLLDREASKIRLLEAILNHFKMNF